MSDTMKIEFYKPKYTLDIKFDGEDSFDLLFKNISGEFFFSADVEGYDSYISFDDEDCKFMNGELQAKVSITDLIETITNRQFRNTNGMAYGEWIPRIVGDYRTPPTLVFDGVRYADRWYWEAFFKEMPKDEIKDFIEFCRESIELPNLEFSSRDFDFDDKGNILVSDRGNSLTIQDDMTIEMAEQFTCKSIEAVEVWQMNYDYGDEFEEKDFTRATRREVSEFESKKSAKKNLKEKHKWNDGDFIFVKEDSKYLYYKEYIVDQFGSGWSDIEKIAKKDITHYEIMKDGELKVWRSFGNEESFDYGFVEKKSLKESIDVKVIYWDDEPTDYLSDVTMNDLKDLMSDANVYKIIDVTNGRKKTIYLSESLKESKKSLKERSYEDEVRLGGVADNVEYYIGLFGENGTLSKVQMKDLYDNLEILWVNNAHRILYNEGVTVLDVCGYKKKLPMMEKKSLKEDWKSDNKVFFNAMAKKYHFSKDEQIRYKDKTYISAIGVLFDRVKTVSPHSDLWYNKINELWECIQVAKENGFDVSYEEKNFDKLTMIPNYSK